MAESNMGKIEKSDVEREVSVLDVNNDDCDAGTDIV